MEKNVPMKNVFRKKKRKLFLRTSYYYLLVIICNKLLYYLYYNYCSIQMKKLKMQFTILIVYTSLNIIIILVSYIKN